MGEDEQPLFSTEVVYKSETYELYKPLTALLNENGISYSEVGGIYDDFGGVPSLSEKRWIVEIGETTYSSLDKKITVSDGDVVKISYKLI